MQEPQILMVTRYELTLQANTDVKTLQKTSMATWYEQTCQTNPINCKDKSPRINVLNRAEQTISSADRYITSVIVNLFLHTTQ